MRKAGTRETGRCIECAHAWLMDDGRGNPLIARCAIDGTRYAARVHRCTKRELFKRATGEPTIHPMEHLH